MNTLTIISKLFLAYLAIYIGFALGYSLFGPNQINYKDPNFFELSTTILIQPTSDLFFNGMASHWYDLKEIQVDENFKKQSGIPIRSNHEKSFDYKNPLSLDNLQYRYLKANEIAVIKPKNEEIKWTVIFCNEDKNHCKQNNVVLEGETKILVDGDKYIWGLNEKNEYIELELLGYTSTNNYYPGITI